MNKWAKTALTALLAVILAGASALGASAADFADETLHYVITYKWGLITKDTGDATLKLRRNGSHYDVSLTGRTRSWADNFYKVRDTLRSRMDAADLRPRSYTKVANEGGVYSRDHIVYSYPSERAVTATCERFKRKKDGSTSLRNKSLQATGPTYDMLSVFYYLRVLPYEELTSRQAVKLTMFSGLAAEQVTIRCVGREQIKVRGQKEKRDAWHIKFRFTTEGKKKSSDDIDAWISADDRRIPLKLEGSLPLGKVNCYYTGGN